MKKNQILLVISLFLITNLIVVSENSRDCYKPKGGFVPDKETAIKIAEAVWYPIYGERINNKKPFKAELLNNKIWIVEGSLPEGWCGGVPYAEINKSDGKILCVSHGK